MLTRPDRCRLGSGSGADQDVRGSADQAPAAAAPAGSATILLVEDEAAVRAILHACLTRCGYVVLAASGTKEAAAVFRQAGGAVDLVLVDCPPPGTGVARLCRRMAASRPGLKVLFMSARPEGVIRHGRNMGPGAPLIQKPFGLGELARRVRDVLGGPLGLRGGNGGDRSSAP
ncbi:MAG TPA: response regulator [Planctomycetota bacterium]|nr:response regulator [Planctomycetota bacterium]